MYNYSFQVYYIFKIEALDLCLDVYTCMHASVNVCLIVEFSFSHYLQIGDFHGAKSATKC